MKYKLPKEVKEKMEKEIKQYDYNRKKLERLKSKGTTRQFLYIEERLQYIEIAYNQLKPNEQEIYNLIFKKGYNWLFCQTMHNIDKTSYYKVYNKSLYLLAQEWGEV